MHLVFKSFNSVSLMKAVTAWHPLILISMLIFLGLPLRSHAQVWECVDANGAKRFTNMQGEAAGCKALNLPQVTSFPSQKSQEANARPSDNKSTSSTTPTNFPKIEPAQQQSRDGERRRILEQELASEQRLLEQAQKDLVEQEGIRLGGERNYQRVLDRLEPYQKKISLHEANIANLRREISNMR